MRRIEGLLGALIASGHDPNWLISNYSFDQLALFARTVLQHKLELVNMVVGPMIGTDGDSYKDARLSKSPSSSNSRNDGSRGRTHKAGRYRKDEDKDRALLMSLAAVGVRVRQVKTSSSNGGDGGSP